MRKLGIGLLVSVVLAGCGFHYWELRWQLQVANFRNELWVSENRIMRDEMNELRSKPSYKQGVMDTVIRTKLDASFDDGLRHAYEALPSEANDTVEAYHRAISDTWCSVYYQQQLAEQKIKAEKAKSFSEGRKDGYESALADRKEESSHPDYSVPKKIQKIQVPQTVESDE